MKNNRKQSITMLVSVLMLLMTITGATYAFFSANAQVQEQSLSVQAATTTGLVYQDSGLLSLNNSIPGDMTEIKTFTVENPDTNTVNQIYTLSMHIDQNGFSAADGDEQLMVYVGYGCTVVDINTEPVSCLKRVAIDLTDSSEKSVGSNVNLYQALVEPGETQTYYVYVKFVDIGSNQDSNKNVAFSGHVELNDPMLIKSDALPYEDIDLNNKIIDLVNVRYTSDDTLTALGLTKKNGTPSIGSIASSDETATGLYSTPDDYGTSYYFRGNVKNNYLKFGKNKSGQEMWWRIVRINGDGSLRIQYDGIQAWSGSSGGTARLAVNQVAWNNTYMEDAKLMGYMYGGSNTNNSSKYYQADMTADNYANTQNAVYNGTETNVKIQTDKWYKENILDTGYANYLSDEIFCNDRSISSGSGYGQKYTEYGGYTRNHYNSKASLLCPQKNDRFTVGDYTDRGQDDSSGYGNGYLKYPVGHVTADEIVFGGGRYEGGSNSSFYLYKNASYWTMTPYWYDSYAYVYFENITGYMGYYGVMRNGFGIAPVVNISPKNAQKLIGNGKSDNPFRFN